MMSEGQARERRPARLLIPRMPYPLSPVAFAGPDDGGALLDFLRRMRAELGSVDDEALDETVQDLTRRLAGVALIVRGPEKVEASLGVKMVKTMLSRQHILKIIWFGVLPESRSSGHAKSLLLAARQLADELGRPLIKEWLAPEIDAPQAKLIARHIPVAGTVYAYCPPPQSVAAEP